MKLPAIDFTSSPPNDEMDFASEETIDDWAAAASNTQPADDDDAYTLSPAPKRGAYRGGATASGRKTRPH